MVKRIIFDLDDTLIPWRDDYWYRFIPMLKKFKVIDNVDDIKRLSDIIDEYEREYTHYDESTFISHINRKMGKEISSSFFDELKSFFTTCIPNSVDVQIVDTLSYLNTKYELVVLTNFFEDLQKKRLENYGIINCFKHVYGGDKFIKPSKESYLLACGPYHPNECIMIGDNFQNDVEGAIKNGLQAIYLNLSHKKVSEDIASINCLEELKDIL